MGEVARTGSSSVLMKSNDASRLESFGLVIVGRRLVLFLDFDLVRCDARDASDCLLSAQWDSRRREVGLGCCICGSSVSKAGHESCEVRGGCW